MRDRVTAVASHLRHDPLVILSMLQFRAPHLVTERIKQPDTVRFGWPGYLDVANHAGEDAPRPGNIVSLEMPAVQYQQVHVGLPRGDKLVLPCSHQTNPCLTHYSRGDG